VLAQNGDVLMKTRYGNGIFNTEASIEPSVSREIMCGMLLDIDSCFRHLEIDSIEWAIKGLSGKEEGKNLIGISLKNIEYDPNTDIFDLFLDVYVSIVKKNFNVRVTVLMKYESDSNGNPFIVAQLHNPNFFLKSAGGTLSVRQKGGKEQFVVQASVSFGWFFNLFISTSNYCAVAEWRIQTFLENLKTEAERRQRGLAIDDRPFLINENNASFTQYSQTNQQVGRLSDDGTPESPFAAHR